MGIVFNLWLQRFDKETIVLRGAQESMARFGSVISSIGDLNKDQFNGEYIYIHV